MQENAKDHRSSKEDVIQPLIGVHQSSCVQRTSEAYDFLVLLTCTGIFYFYLVIFFFFKSECPLSNSKGTECIWTPKEYPKTCVENKPISSSFPLHFPTDDSCFKMKKIVAPEMHGYLWCFDLKGCWRHILFACPIHFQFVADAITRAGFIFSQHMLPADSYYFKLYFIEHVLSSA